MLGGTDYHVAPALAAIPALSLKEAVRQWRLYTNVQPQGTLMTSSANKVNGTVCWNQTKCQVSNTEISQGKNEVLARSCAGISPKDS